MLQPKLITEENYERKLLLFLVEFEDQAIKYSAESWHERIFSKENKSLANFYQEETHRRINIIPAEEGYYVTSIRTNQSYSKTIPVFSFTKSMTRTGYDEANNTSYDVITLKKGQQIMGFITGLKYPELTIPSIATLEMVSGEVR